MLRNYFLYAGACLFNYLVLMQYRSVGVSLSFFATLLFVYVFLRNDERNQFRSFKQRQKRQQKLQIYKQVMKREIPHGILIVKRGAAGLRTLMLNDQFLEIFSLHQFKSRQSSNVSFENRHEVFEGVLRSITLGEEP